MNAYTNKLRSQGNQEPPRLNGSFQIVHEETGKDENIIIATFFALMSLVSMALVLSYFSEAFGLWVILISFIWCLRNPYLFAVLLLPGMMIYENIAISSSISWSVLRAVVVIIIFGMVLHPGNIRKGFRSIPPYLLWSMILILVAYFFSALANGWPIEAPERMTSHILRIILMGIIFISIYALKDARILLIGLTLQGISMLVGGLYLWQNFGTYMALRGLDIADVTSNKGLLLFAYSAASNATLSITSGLALIGLGKFFDKRLFQIMAYTGGIVLFLSSLMSSRRQAVVAMIFAILLLLWLDRSRQSLVIISILLLMTIAFNSIGYFDQFFSQRETILDEFTGHGTGRLDLITLGLDLWNKSPIWGVGPGTQPRYYDSQNQFSHNTIISAALEGGIFAVLLVFILMFGIVKQVLQAAHVLRTLPESPWPLIFLCSLANLLVFTFVTSDLLVSNAFLLLLASLSAYCVRTLESAAKLREKVIV